MCINTSYFFQTWINVCAIMFSILLFFSVALIYNSSCPTCNPPSNPYWSMQMLMVNPLFYFICILSPVTALLPRFLYKSIQGTLFPSQVQVGRQLLKSHPEWVTHVLNKLNSNTGCALQKQLDNTVSHISDIQNPRETKKESEQKGQTLFTKIGNQPSDQNYSPCKDSYFFEKPDNHSIASSQLYYQEHPVISNTLSVNETLNWSSHLEQSDVSLINWITSTPLFKSNNKPKQPKNSIQDESQHATVLPVVSYLPQDQEDSKECNINFYQDRLIRTEINGEVQETTFL
ncbi:phospholipid-transporting ATPase VA-like [Bombina bombina]|uniref:phospholipid-transporting ATPase VA-like n=1 Tax=Bombina bombina TaxID=8345 RepID=UPI00235AC217|nr:phospholipid-transporting ATPase VA-like [Bombina bombina]